MDFMILYHYHVDICVCLKITNFEIKLAGKVHCQTSIQRNEFHGSYAFFSLYPLLVFLLWWLLYLVSVLCFVCAFDRLLKLDWKLMSHWISTNVIFLTTLAGKSIGYSYGLPSDPFFLIWSAFSTKFSTVSAIPPNQITCSITCIV